MAKLWQNHTVTLDLGDLMSDLPLKIFLFQTSDIRKTGISEQKVSSS